MICDSKSGFSAKKPAYSSPAKVVGAALKPCQSAYADSPTDPAWGWLSYWADSSVSLAARTFKLGSHRRSCSPVRTVTLRQCTKYLPRAPWPGSPATSPEEKWLTWSRLLPHGGRARHQLKAIASRFPSLVNLCLCATHAAPKGPCSHSHTRSGTHFSTVPKEESSTIFSKANLHLQLKQGTERSQAYGGSR